MATTKPRATQIRGLAKQQAPYLFNIIPDSYLPDSTGDVDVYGEFFTPDMTVSADGQTINYFNFINSGHIKVNMTRGSAEGTFGLTLDNGIEAYFPDVLLIVLGEVFAPATSDWINIVEPIEVINDSALTQTFNSQGSAEWNKSIDITKDWAIRFNPVATPLGEALIGKYGGGHMDLFLVNENDGIEKFRYQVYVHGSQGMLHNVETDVDPLGYSGKTSTYDFKNLPQFELRFIDGILYAYANNVLQRTLTTVLNQNLRLVITPKWYDYTKIKYIELAT